MLKCMNKALGVKFKNECETLNHDEILHILNFCARDPHDLRPLRLRIVEFASMFNIHTHGHAIFVATELVYLLHPTFNKVTKKKLLVDLAFGPHPSKLGQITVGSLSRRDRVHSDVAWECYDPLPPTIVHMIPNLEK